MSARILRQPAGRHSRTGTDALADAVRHGLLLVVVGRLDPDTDAGLLPWDASMTSRDLRDREWQSVKGALGDLAEDAASLLTVALVALSSLAIGAVIAAFAPTWVSVPLFALAALALIGWRLRVASRRVDRALTEVLFIETNTKQDKENEA